MVLGRQKAGAWPAALGGSSSSSRKNIAIARETLNRLKFEVPVHRPKQPAWRGWAGLGRTCGAWFGAGQTRARAYTRTAVEPCAEHRGEGGETEFKAF